MKKEEDLEKHEEKFQRQMEEELENEKKNLEILKKGYEMRGEIVREEKYKNVKLSKLIVTKFEATHMDWFGFWNYYESKINRSKLYL